MQQFNFPSAMLDYLQSQLQPAEKLLWVGVPDWSHLPDSLHSKSRWMIWGLLAYWSGLATVALLAARGLLTPFMLIVLVTAGIMVMLLTRVFNRLIGAHRQFYALTDRRVLILSGKRLQSYDGTEIEFVQCVMHADGTGDVLFKHAMLPHTMMIGTVTAQQDVPSSLGFFGVIHPQYVESLMLQTFHIAAETRSAAQSLRHAPAAEWEHVQQA